MWQWQVKSKNTFLYGFWNFSVDGFTKQREKKEKPKSYQRLTKTKLGIKGLGKKFVSQHMLKAIRGGKYCDLY